MNVCTIFAQLARSTSLDSSLRGFEQDQEHERASIAFQEAFLVLW